MQAVPVTKMHGTRNDFVVLDGRTRRVGDLSLFAKAVCDRRAGVGADGLLVIAESDKAQAKMRIFNADGSEAEMCGNGARCVARYLSELGMGDDLVLEMIAGLVKTSVVSRSPFEVRVNMGAPEFEPHDLPYKDAIRVSLGNPHLVFFEKGLDDVDLPALATQANASGHCPQGINTHVAVKAGSHRLLVRHWERGAGVTMACGSGAVASATAAMRRGDVLSPVEVQTPGGRLIVEWSGKGEAFLTGAAVRVFDTEIELPSA